MDTNQHNQLARTREGNRLVRVAPVVIAPGEEAPVNLPHAGMSATEYLRVALEGDGLPVGRTNKTDREIVIYSGIWRDTGNNAGYFWREWIDFI